MLDKVSEKVLAIQSEEDKKNLVIDKLFTSMQVVNLAPGSSIPKDAKIEYKMTEVKETEEVGT